MNPKCFCKRAKNSGKTKGGGGWKINFANVILWCNWYQTIIKKSRMQIFHQNTLGIVNFLSLEKQAQHWDGKLFTILNIQRRYKKN